MGTLAAIESGIALAALVFMRNQIRSSPAYFPHRTLLTVALAVVAGFFLACTPHSVSLDEVKAPVRWGAAENVRQLRHLWIADQPDAAGIEAAAMAGVEIVIDLRGAGEQTWDEASAVRAKGLTYYNVPIAKEGPFASKAFEEIERLLKDHEGVPTLLHCSSGNRAAAWLTTHLVRTHDMPFETALEIGERAGITKRAIVEKVAAYLGETAPEAAADETTSTEIDPPEKARLRSGQLFGVLPAEVPSGKNPIAEEKVAFGRLPYCEPPEFG